jgi:mono/diheme cytochrome c family protein
VTRIATIGLLAAAAMLPIRSAPGAQPAAQPGAEFDRDVRPILQDCARCHGGIKRQSGLSFLAREDALAPARSGKRAIVPGKPEESELLRRVSADGRERMPPEGKPLATAQIEALRKWIAAGAPWDQHWAFAPLNRQAPPAVKEDAAPRNPIDRFILHRLEGQGLQPSPAADRPTLIRRLSLDLLGLPPDVSDVDAFLDDTRPDAYERLVDRLLASPHFGERWGRHWLDLARYADSDGYEVDKVRPHAWYWRDWVIRAVNDDMPFDQFTTHQLAGDLLPGADFPEKLATAFHRQTLTNNESGIDKEEYRVKAVMDRATTTATVWLGLTLACAQCHNHPYDALSQRQFYGLFAIFNNADEVDLPLSKEAEARYGWEGLRTALEKKSPKTPALKLAALAERDAPRPTYLFHRGDFLNPKKDETIAPAVLSAPPSAIPNPPERLNRLDLARWLVAPSNPLTPRVAVNHLWMHLFGNGLVRTPDDFGARGEPPTHPELLDWLAGEFVRQGWSRKQVIRLIVTSAAYRQSSRHRPDLAQVDPQNRLLHRQNRFRVEAEIVRDLHLAAGGLLAPRIGGPGVFPPVPKDLQKISFRSQLAWPTSTGPDRYRRGMYTFFKRSLPEPNLVVFDCPDASAATLQRSASNTPLQALTTLNHEVFFEAAQATARRVLQSNLSTDEERVARAFRLALARRPTERERDRLLDLLQTNRAWYQGQEGAPSAETAAWVATLNVLLNLDEFITRE